MKALRKLLLPFSLIYGAVTSIRNFLFEKGYLKSVSFDIPVICVGNLSTGGTGKSPMIEFLIKNLKEDYQIGVVSRGYKRKTKGFVEVEVNHSAPEVGDEPLQIKRKYPDVSVVVSEKRSMGIGKIKDRVDVVLLDDAFQHRSVTPSFSILLTSYGDLYTDDWILPAGNLRESKRGADRADFVVVTKCPDNLSEERMREIEKKLKLKPNQKLFFTGISYASEIKSSTLVQPLESLKNRTFALVTGIANPKPLTEFLTKKNLNFTHHSFPDHHFFTASDLEKLDKEQIILTTEKDFMRLNPHIKNAQLFFLPMEIYFLKNREAFVSGLKKLS